MPNRPLSNDKATPRMKVQTERHTVKIITFECLNIDDPTKVSAKKIQNNGGVQPEF